MLYSALLHLIIECLIPAEIASKEELNASHNKAGTSRHGYNAATSTTEQLTESQRTDKSDTSKDLFDSDSDSILMAAG